MRGFGLLVIGGAIALLVWLHMSHEDGLSGVWADMTANDPPGVNRIEQEFELDLDP